MSSGGLVVILTGGNGAGKGTVGPLAAMRLTEETGLPFAYVYGPKANDYTARVREIVLDPDPTRRPSSFSADAMLWFSLHFEAADVVSNLRRKGINVILDRGPETTLVYNVLGRGLQLVDSWLEEAYRSALTSLMPNLGLILDVTAEETLRRSGQQSLTDHYQDQALKNHEERRHHFLSLVERQDYCEWRVINAMPPVETVLDAVVEAIKYASGASFWGLAT
jgi:thymidylate kinase